MASLSTFIDSPFKIKDTLASLFKPQSSTELGHEWLGYVGPRSILSLSGTLGGRLVDSHSPAAHQRLVT